MRVQLSVVRLFTDITSARSIDAITVNIMVTDITVQAIVTVTDMATVTTEFIAITDVVTTMVDTDNVGVEGKLLASFI